MNSLDSRDDNEWARFRHDYSQEVQAMSGFVERLKREAWEEGLQQGTQQGLQQGEVRLLMRLLQSRFGELPQDVRERIESADEQTLLVWSERLLTASRLDEVVH